MMPAIYGNSYHIAQSPGYVTITYEMVHDTRVIPLGGRPTSARIRQYLGDARGLWEGDTLVVETTNFMDKCLPRRRATSLKVVERFTPTGPDPPVVRDHRRPAHVDPAMDVLACSSRETRPAAVRYECHEGNYGLPNILSAARAEERTAVPGPP